MLAFVGCNVRNGGEDIACMCSCTFNAVTVVDTTFSSFRIHIKVLEIIVEIDRTSAKISSKESGMGSKDCGNIDSAFLAKRKSDTR